MKNIDLNELKAIQIEILNDIDRFCRENSLTYWLAYGTLLGAVRHKGYIPWDDDIDLHMPRPDYERFIATYNNQNSTLKVVDHRTDSSYTIPFAKVCHTGTVLKEDMYSGTPLGVYVDIFPLDGIADANQARKSKQLYRLLNKKTLLWSGSRPLFDNIKIMVAKLLLLPVSTRSILRRMHENSLLCNYGTAEKVGILCEICSGCVYDYEHDVLDKKIFESSVAMPFEGGEYPAPQGYKEYLRVKYGDYMQLPPEDMRISKHKFSAWWKE